MAYVDFVYYTANYTGTVFKETADFSRYERKAEAYLNKCTFGNIKETTSISDEIKTCICEISELIYKEDRRDNRVSESNDGYSVSWDVSRSTLSKVNEIVQMYLDNDRDRKLLYRGVN